MLRYVLAEDTRQPACKAAYFTKYIFNILTCCLLISILFSAFWPFLKVGALSAGQLSLTCEDWKLQDAKRERWLALGV